LVSGLSGEKNVPERICCRIPSQLCMKKTGRRIVQGSSLVRKCSSMRCLLSKWCIPVWR